MNPDRAETHAEAEAPANHWRAICRRLAQERANAEAIHLWEWNGQTRHVPFSHRWEHVQQVVRLALPLEAAILWDADKLSKPGVSALVSGMLAPYDMGHTLSERRHRHALWVRTTLARTVESMNTPTAQQAARRRFATMSAALEAWQAEEEGL